MMETKSRARSKDPSDSVRPIGWCPKLGERLRSALALAGKRRRLSFLLLIAERVLVGFCDLLLAGAMYLLFLLLQGASPVHHGWWTPKTTLSGALITASLVLLRVLLDLLSTRSVVGHIQASYTDILLRLTHGYNNMQWVRFAQRNRSELLNHAMHTAREAANFYHLGIEIAAGGIVIVGMTIALVYQSPPAACGLGVTAGMLYAVHRFLIRKKLQRSASKREEALRILQRDLADMFSSGREMRSYGIEAFFSQRIASQARSAAVSHRRVAFLPQVARILTDQGIVLLFLCVVIAVELRHGDVRQLLSLLIFYFVLSRRLLPLISQISFMSGQMESSYKNVQIVADELNECSLYRASNPAAQSTNGNVVVDIKQISFSFDEGAPLLRNVNLCLRQGERVVLQGISGSGKSSLMNIIAGVLQPTAGSIHIDRTKVAYVPQDVALLDDSIRNNLLFGFTTKCDEDLVHALEVANLRGFVAAQPMGLEAGVGDNGILFSGGQRQRLGLARAILRGASLLLLDEATSALDEENESHVLGNLSASGIAVLLVTHRVPKPDFAQRIVRLEHGLLIEESIQEVSLVELETATAAL
jgi:ABC-type transport system involved in cytochrome bd biosynthesis fused ATPase/permease subunit